MTRKGSIHSASRGHWGLVTFAESRVRDDMEAMFGIGPRIHRLFEFAAAASCAIRSAPVTSPWRAMR